MTDITQCPQCGTHFRITKGQSESHQGMVRCGRCQSVFNAADHIYTAPQQLDLPLVLDEIADYTGIHPAYNPYTTTDSYNTIDSSAAISPEAAARLANDFRHIPDIYLDQSEKESAPKHKWLWNSGSILLSIYLLLQALFFLRVDIAARLPGVKPAMLQICELLKCTIPLPQKIDLLSIESSELQSDPNQPSIITLHAQLRSRASYAMTYPDIELTLTDIRDTALARRTFKPANYLLPAENEQLGIPPNREVSIKLHLNTTDLKPAGYRLFLFYQP